MCAIAGMVGLQAEDGIIMKMLDTMRRRGPDGNGVFRDKGTTLLHSRLAIIDPEGGAQPMTLEWEEETYVLVYNGELYNAEELRVRLQAMGHIFQGHSDTEVILHAYAQYTDACLEYLNGIFSFAVWEIRQQRLFLARDRIGVKPLFYKLHQGGLLFSSEVKTILCYPDVSAKLDAEGAVQVIMLGPGRFPGSGVFHGTQEVRPGYCVSFKDGKLSTRCYWKLQDREHTESFADTVEHVRYLVRDSIVRQMVSDVPVGTFLSGGLDSSIITAICNEEMKKTGKLLQTFSVDYLHNERFFIANKFQPDADGDYIRFMHENLGTVHQWTTLSPEDLIGTLEEATIARDFPGMADVDFSLLAFCKEVREKVKVALSGECADEIFGGYPWYRDPEVRSRAGFPWAQNACQRANLLTPNITLDSKSFVMDAYLQTCQESDILPGTSSEERRIKEMVNLNFYHFMQTLLERKDRMSMYCGLEVRVPFCDYRIAEYLYSVPWMYKEYMGREKGLLRSAMEDLLPEKILYRKKSPYPKTFDPQYTKLVSERMDALLKTDSPLWYLVRKENARTLVESDSSWPWYGQLMRRPQTIAYLLQVDFWLRHYNVEMCF